MDSRISTSEAAKRLGVSVRRVQGLVKEGALEAEKVSGIWLVDEASVADRMRNVRKTGGRPARGSSRNERRFTLMNRGHEICEAIYDVRRQEFTSLGELIDGTRAPIGISANGRGISLADFNLWWRMRGIPITRVNIDQLLREAGVQVPEELLQRNLGLSLSDQYWINPQDSGLDWEQVNFFNNDFEQVGIHTAAFVDNPGVLAQPSNTSDGNLEKTWVVRDGVRMLKKHGLHNNQEPYNEVVATALHRRLLEGGEYVTYTLEGSGASACSLCTNFVSDEEEYIPALYVQRVLRGRENSDEYHNYLDSCAALGAENVRELLDRMIVCDDILANTDRHFRNFGIVRNVESLECRPAPVFDSGTSLWCDIDEEQLVRGERSFTSKQFYANPARQLLLVNDFSWFNASALGDFIDEACEILSTNESLLNRLPSIRSALKWRIDRMADIAEWA